MTGEMRNTGRKTFDSTTFSAEIPTRTLLELNPGLRSKMPPNI